MEETAAGDARFTEVVLAPSVHIAATVDAALATRLHKRAHDLCFIANSVSFPVRCAPTILVGDQTVPAEA